MHALLCKLVACQEQFIALLCHLMFQNAHFGDIPDDI